MALVNAQKVGLGLTVFIFISVRTHGENWANQFSKVIENMPQIQSTSRTSGDQGYLIKARVLDVQAYDNPYQQLISRIELAEINASFVMEELKDTN